VCERWLGGLGDGSHSGWGPWVKPLYMGLWDKVQILMMFWKKKVSKMAKIPSSKLGLAERGETGARP